MFVHCAVWPVPESGKCIQENLKTNKQSDDNNSQNIMAVILFQLLEQYFRLFQYKWVVTSASYAVDLGD